jgi:hypothetical protein
MAFAALLPVLRDLPLSHPMMFLAAAKSENEIDFWWRRSVAVEF